MVQMATLGVFAEAARRAVAEAAGAELQGSSDAKIGAAGCRVLSLDDWASPFSAGRLKLA